MRSLLVFLLLAVSAVAVAKPTIAIAPIQGDAGNKIANVVAEVAAQDAEVIGPKDTAKAMDKLGLPAELDRKDLSKLRAKLEADAVVSGTVEKDGKTRTLELGVTRKGRKTQKFTLTFKSSASEKFRTELREELAKRTGEGSGEADDADGEDHDVRKQREAEEETRRKEKQDREDAEAAEAQRKKRRLSDREDDDRKRTKKRTDRDDRDADGDSTRKKKKRHRADRDHGDDDEGEPGARDPLTEAALLVNAGPVGTRRTLTYDSSGMTPPPPVGTAAFAARIEGELYPGAFSTTHGPAAAIGVFGAYEKAFGLKINVPVQANDAPITQSHAVIGVRYRFHVGDSTIAVGVGYAKRRYVADRSALTDPKSLDMPDVKYAAIAPGVLARIAATPTIAVVASVDALLMRSTGPIQRDDSYGPAKVTAFELAAGVDIALGAHYGVQIAADVSQIGLAFTGKPGSQASARGVSSATDRTMSLGASLVVLY